jgi:hypothetical protein
LFFSGDPRRDQRAAQLTQRLRQLGQKTAWSQNFDVNAFDFIGGKEAGKSTWRTVGNECFTPIHGEVKNYNEVPA